MVFYIRRSYTGLLTLLSYSGGVNGTYLVYPTVAVVQWRCSERYISRVPDCDGGAVVVE